MEPDTVQGRTHNWLLLTGEIAIAVVVFVGLGLFFSGRSRMQQDLNLHIREGRRQSPTDEDAARRRTIEAGMQEEAAAGALFLAAGTAALLSRSRLRKRASRALSRHTQETPSTSEWERERSRVLELIGNNQPLELICEAIAGIVESRHDRVSCGIAVVRGGTLGFVSARRLSTTVVRALNSPDRAAGGSPSQLAFHSGKPVFVQSIATHPLWQGQRPSCSTPVLFPPGRFPCSRTPDTRSERSPCLRRAAGILRGCPDGCLASLEWPRA